MGDEAERAAFKNGRADSIGLLAWQPQRRQGSARCPDFRSGQSVGVINLKLNPTCVTDTALRRAGFAAADRLSWLRSSSARSTGKSPRPALGDCYAFPEGLPGRHAFNPGPEAAAAKILEAAGYSKNGDYYAKGGKTAGFSITHWFGMQPPWLSLQNLEQQLKAAG